MPATPPGAGPAFVELFGEGAGFTQVVAVQTPHERCGRRRHLLEACGERTTGARVLVTRSAAAQDVLSGEHTKRVGQCRCGWFPCVCSLISRECACVIVVVSLCVFPECHRWEAGHQEGEQGQFLVRQDTGSAHEAWRLPEGVLPRFKATVCL